MKKETLIFGGTSGLGLHLAKKFYNDGPVFVTGRSKPDCQKLNFLPTNISQPETTGEIIKMAVSSLSNTRLARLVICAGFFQDGLISDLSDKDIDLMLEVGIRAPILLIKEVVKSQNQLDSLIVITSTSQWIPRKREPVYTAIKAGMGHLAESLSLDARIKKTLHVAPAGMRTNFWKLDGRDTSDMLKPNVVAGIICNQESEDYKFRYTRINRSPLNVEVVKERQS